ncbi:MAG: hypothetical protein LUI87_02755, partial [Lachnospiraceae bacterium]|nr:hypothetical protein [Lachnospiraceae bacterium]
MPLTYMQKNKLKQLSLEEGGVFCMGGNHKATPTPTIVIGLGGLGGETLNLLKKKMLRDLG